ncbi:MAG: hypothetical protein JWQ79_508 [Mucilaginibacter sp.]|jgi:hypothetical protein|nr:hypothetical protein [Mucilaginibacter sp.]
MKKLIIIAALIVLSGRLFAQAPARAAGALPPPLSTREVSGIVKDETGQTVIGALVTLKSAKDTIRTSTNEDGIFIMKDVKLASFNITVASIGSVTFVKKYLNSDITRRIVLDPITLKTKTNELNQVNINGTPTITYKTDTVEYRASDYKVRENATLDELLKKAEGFEVGSDGTLTHQGQQVMKARVNGKDFAGGNVAQAIQNLPADIVDKFQVVDDYGDQAGRTGIKDGDPTKVLNITTKADKSVGNLARVTASGGNDDRYDERLFAQRLDGNQQLGFIGNYTNTVNGVASTGISSGGNGGGGGGGGGNGGVSTSGGSGGTTTNATGSVNYRDQVSKTLQVNSNYRYTSTIVNSITNSTGANYLRTPDGVNHTTNFTNNSTSTNNNKTHNASVELEYTPDSSNFWRITPGISYTGSNATSSPDQIYKGYQNQSSTGMTATDNTTINYSLVALYQYIFKKDHRRNISAQFSLNNGINRINTAQNTDIKYYADSTLNNLLLDSLVHRTVNRSSNTQDYRLSLTYVEPLTRISQLEFHAQSEYKKYNNSTLTDNISPAGTAAQIDSLSNVYNYSFLQTRLSVNYRLNKPKYNISLGVMAIPTHLQGMDVSTNAPPTNRSDFYVIPLFRFQYQWSRTQQLSINYTGTPTEPSFTQIQPVPDYSNPQNPIFGNPNLGPSFTHTLTTRYNNYFPNSKLNISANVVTSLYENQIITNNVYVTQDVTNTRLVGGVLQTTTVPIITNETYYFNYTGGKSLLGNYNISKQFDDRAYNLTLNGTVTYGYNYGESGGDLFHSTSWDVSNRFGPRINPNTSLEINPYVSYEVNRSFFTISPPGAINSNYTKTAFNLEGKFYLLSDRTFTVEYNLTKNYINGISANLTKNPFVANAYLEKELFKRKNGQLRISAFDIFDQNNFINRTSTVNGYTDTRSNALSRYFLVSFILNLQKWSGTPTRNGRQMQRRGDGSFIY